jgi:hypothetical protein
MDLAGNYLFSFDSAFLSKEGQGNLGKATAE